jgi:hypothetical protein
MLAFILSDIWHIFGLFLWHFIWQSIWQIFWNHIRHSTCFFWHSI